MNTKKRKLNRGLDALLGTDLTKKRRPARQKRAQHHQGMIFVNYRWSFYNAVNISLELTLMKPRLQELADSIKAQGVMQPIVVRSIGADRYEIVAGERRWRASQLAALDTIPAIVRDICDETAIAMALIENIQRENLNPLEEARALKRLQTEFDLSQQEVATAVGKSRPVIANLLRLLSLEREVAEMLEHGRIDAGHGKVLLALDGGDQVRAARKVVDSKLSVRQTEALVKAMLAPAVDTAPQRKDPDIDRLERQLSERFGTKVVIENKNGRGKLVIQYSDLDVLDGILNRIQ